MRYDFLKSRVREDDARYEVPEFQTAEILDREKSNVCIFVELFPEFLRVEKSPHDRRRRPRVGRDVDDVDVVRRTGRARSVVPGRVERHVRVRPRVEIDVDALLGLLLEFPNRARHRVFHVFSFARSGNKRPLAELLVLDGEKQGLSVVASDVGHGEDLASVNVRGPLQASRVESSYAMRRNAS